MTGPYIVRKVGPLICACGRWALFRVVDAGKKYGDRYPGVLMCRLCAERQAASYNAGLTSPDVEAR